MLQLVQLARRGNTFSLFRVDSEIKMRIPLSGLFVGVEPPAQAGCLLYRVMGKRGVTVQRDLS